MGRDLVSIENDVENAAVLSLHSNTVWIANNDRANEGQYKKTYGTSTYTNWNSGEPNDSRGEDCTQQYATGKWNDLKCSNQLPSVCGPLLCPAGQGIQLPTTTSDATCVSCVAGTTYSSDSNPGSCIPVTPYAHQTCPAGQGRVAPTTTSDYTCANCVAGSTFSSGTSTSACAAVNPSTTCPAGQGRVAPTTTSDYTCENCVAGSTYSSGTSIATTASSGSRPTRASQSLAP